MEPTQSCEREYDFTLVLFDSVKLTEDVENALFDAGCDDATISVRNGRMYLTFSRMADSLKKAILTAIQNVTEAGIGAEILRVDDCNLVTQSDIARRIGRSRQLIHQYITGLRGPGNFPPPACNITDEAPLWYWCEIAYWLWENDMIKEDVLREAQELSAINTVLDLNYHKHFVPELLEEVINLIADPSNELLTDCEPCP